MSHSRYFAGRDEKNEEKLAHLLAALPPYCKASVPPRPR